MKEYPLDTIAGIDYSLNCPAICVITPVRDPLFLVPFEYCRFYYLTNKKNSVVQNDRIHGSFFGIQGDGQPRYESVAGWVMDVLQENNVRAVGLENYAFGAFPHTLVQMAEATGLLKYFLHQSSIPVNLYTPSSIKKCATGKGNAKKDLMYDAWLQDTEIDLLSVFNKKKVVSPIHDLVDAYYIACCERAENIQQSKGFPNEEANNQRDDSR